METESPSDFLVEQINFCQKISIFRAEWSFQSIFIVVIYPLLRSQ